MSIICPKCRAPSSDEALYCFRCYGPLKKSAVASRPALLESRPSILRRPIPRPIIFLLFGGGLIWFVQWTTGKASEIEKAWSQKTASDLAFLTAERRLIVTKKQRPMDEPMSEEYVEAPQPEETDEIAAESPIETMRAKGIPNTDGWQVWTTTNFEVWSQDRTVPPGFLSDLESLYTGLKLDFSYLTDWVEGSISFYLFRDREEYKSDKMRPPWSTGVAYPKDRVVMTFVQPRLNNVTAHELAHLLFEGFIQDKRSELRWLIEGMAVYAEVHYARQSPKWLHNYAKLFAKGKGLPVKSVIEVPPSFQTSPQVTSKWYAESYSLTQYLLEVSSSLNFQYFVESLAEGNDIPEALAEGYGVGMGSYEALESGWKEWLKNETK